MKVKLTKKEYTYTWEKDSMRTAKIVFEQLGKQPMKFTSCRFQGISCNYTIDDWRFLQDLSKEILRLVKEDN